MKVLVVTLLAFVAPSLAAPHVSRAHLVRKFNVEGSPAVPVYAPTDAFVPGQGLPFNHDASSLFLVPHRGFGMTYNVNLSPWFQRMVRPVVLKQNTVQKRRYYTPSVNRFHTGYAAAGAYSVKKPSNPSSTPSTPPTTTTTTTSTSTSTTSTSTSASTSAFRPPSFQRDTAVNYLGPVPRDNPDAEVFDKELVREDARRHFAATGSPSSSAPAANEATVPRL